MACKRMPLHVRPKPGKCYGELPKWLHASYPWRDEDVHAFLTKIDRTEMIWPRGWDIPQGSSSD
jgi:hypothetical protein